ncbi:MAG: hypothetical protein Q8S84_03525 [bacterium]|nr:hypothetical protein [bacterium]MDP3380592.1 hypothetical protein [bacterium]
MKKIDMSDIDYSKEIELINISVRGLHKFDPIKLLIENYLLFANDTNSIIDVNKVSDYIDYYIPNLVKDCNHIVEKLNIFREWRKQYLDKNLVCDKLLDFIEDNKLNLYLFLPRYYDILPLKFKNF